MLYKHDPTGKKCHKIIKRTCTDKCAAHRQISGFGTFCVELDFMDTLSQHFEAKGE